MLDVNKAVDFVAVHREDMIQERSEIIQGLAAVFTAAPPRADTKARMSEAIFRAVFLPMFLGEENPRYPDIRPGNWSTFAGGPHARVDVVDPHNKVLFTVPSLMQNQLVAPVDTKDAIDMRTVTKQASLYQNNVPMVAQEYLNAELTKRASLMKSGADVSAVLDEWKKILIYYGIETPNAAQSAPSTSASEDNDYEEVAP